MAKASNFKLSFSEETETRGNTYSGSRRKYEVDIFSKDTQSHDEEEAPSLNQKGHQASYYWLLAKVARR